MEFLKGLEKELNHIRKITAANFNLLKNGFFKNLKMREIGKRIEVGMLGTNERFCQHEKFVFATLVIRSKELRRSVLKCIFLPIKSKSILI